MLFKCPECGVIFEAEEDMRAHTRAEHESSNILYDEFAFVPQPPLFIVLPSRSHAPPWNGGSTVVTEAPGVGENEINLDLGDGGPGHVAVDDGESCCNCYDGDNEGCCGDQNTCCAGKEGCCGEDSCNCGDCDCGCEDCDCGGCDCDCGDCTIM